MQNSSTLVFSSCVLWLLDLTLKKKQQAEAGRRRVENIITCALMTSSKHKPGAKSDERVFIVL